MRRHNVHPPRILCRAGGVPIRATILAFCILLVVPALGVASSAPPAHDAEGTIAFGDGRLKLAPGKDHVVLDTPAERTIGFSYTGDVRYETTYFTFADGLYYRVTLMAPLGAKDVAFTFDWIGKGGTPMVPVPTATTRPTNCVDVLCFL